MTLLILQVQAVTDIDERTLKWHQQLQGRWYYKSSALRYAPNRPLLSKVQSPVP